LKAIKRSVFLKTDLWKQHKGLFLREKGLWMRKIGLFFWEKDCKSNLKVFIFETSPLNPTKSSLFPEKSQQKWVHSSLFSGFWAFPCRFCFKGWLNWMVRWG